MEWLLVERHVCTFQGGHLEYVSDGQESIIRSISLDT